MSFLEQLSATLSPLSPDGHLGRDHEAHSRYVMRTSAYKTVLIHHIPFIFTCNEDDRIMVLANHSIVIKGDTIVDVCEAEQVENTAAFDVIYDARKRGGVVVTPGFVNTHAHIHMYLMRSAMLLDEGENIDETIVAMAEWGKHETDESMTIAAIGDVTEQQKYGITTTLTHGPSFIAAENAARMTKQNIVNAVSAVSNSRPSNTPEAVAALAKNQDRNASRLAIAIHYLYKADTTTLEKIEAIARDYGLLTTFHMAESPHVVAQNKARHGVREVETMNRAKLLNNNTLVSHVLHVNDGEIRQLADAGVGIAHLPTSNVIHKSGVFKFWEFDAAGAFDSLSLGTDGVVSKNRLDLLTEAYQARITHLYDRTVKFGSLFKMLTANGARVLGENTRGKIIKGAKADIAFWKLKDRGFIPYDEKNPVTLLGNLITHGGRTVRDLMINGKFIIRDRRHQFVNESALLKETQLAHMQLRERVNADKN